MHGHPNVVQYLLEQSADKEARTNHGSTPLHVSAINGHLNMVQFLVEQGTDKEARKNNRRTPLYISVIVNEFRIAVQYLVQQGADITTCDNDKKIRHPLKYAVECNFTHIAEFLVQQERFQLLVVHDIRELLTRLGLYSVERNAILSMLQT